jgi:predicted phosphodiesterase
MPFYIGDTHGNFHNILNKMNRYLLSDCYIVHVGDFGAYNFNMSKIKAFDTLLKLNNIKMFVVRGNHDDPSFFDGQTIGNITFVADYTVLELDGDRILCIGGAVSVDRVARIKKGLDYHTDEKLIFNRKALEGIMGVNVLVTHTAPDFCSPLPNYDYSDFIQSYAENDAKLIEDLMEERANLTKIFEVLKANNKIEQHYYGHFHKSYTEEIDGCIHRLLNVDEIY